LFFVALPGGDETPLWEAACDSFVRTVAHCPPGENLGGYASVCIRRALRAVIAPWARHRPRGFKLWLERKDALYDHARSELRSAPSVEEEAAAREVVWQRRTIIPRQLP
jgi:hypothetical protein